MTIDLKAKRTALVARAKNLEEMNDYWRDQAAKGNKISDRLIVFQCDDELVVLAEDVPTITAALTKFDAEVAPGWADSLEPAVRLCLKNVARYLAKPPSELRVQGQVWNCYNMALTAVGVQVSITDGTKEPAQ